MIASFRYPLKQTAITSQQGVVCGVAFGVIAVWYLYAYWKQEQQVPKSKTLITEEATFSSCLPY